MAEGPEKNRVPDTTGSLTTMALIATAVATLVAGGQQAGWSPSDWTIPAVAAVELGKGVTVAGSRPGDQQVV